MSGNRGSVNGIRRGAYGFTKNLVVLCMFHELQDYEGIFANEMYLL